MASCINYLRTDAFNVMGRNNDSIVVVFESDDSGMISTSS